MEAYLDHAATSPLRPAARRAMASLLGELWGNPSSPHRPGRRARACLEQARERCAASLGVPVEEIVFTSGATEANHLALTGVLSRARPGSRLVVSAVEHPSVWQVAQAWSRAGNPLDVLAVDQGGRVCPEELAAILTPETALVSVMAVNNETGTRQPVRALAERCASCGVPFHCDLSQAGWELGALASGDLRVWSAHKVGGPPGAGILAVRAGFPLAPVLLGGGQEDGRRAGTENLLAIVGMAAAMEALALDLEEEGRRLSALRERLEGRLASVPEALRLGGGDRAPHVSAWLFAGLKAESILVGLDLAGVCASSGAACSSGGIQPSRVLEAMGFSEERALGLVRFSLGWSTREDEVDHGAEVTARVIADLRERRRGGPGLCG